MTDAGSAMRYHAGSHRTRLDRYHGGYHRSGLLEVAASR